MTGIIGLVIAAGAGYWVYQDSQQHQIDNGVVYAVVTFLIIIVGLPLYLIKRNNHLKAIGGQS